VAPVALHHHSDDLGFLQFLSVINVIYTFTSLFAFVFTSPLAAGILHDDRRLLHVHHDVRNGQFGYGAALALLLFLIVLTLTIAQVKLFPYREVQQGS